MNIIFFGSSSYVIPVIEILNKNFDLSLIVTTEQNETDAVSSYCIKNKINYLSVSSVKELSSKLSVLNPQLGVVADFRLIIPPDILNLFKKGVLNIHPSLLPKYRGPTPVQTAILNGEKKTGVTIIKLDEEIDHGEILAQKEEIILPNDTAETLYKRLFKIGAEVLADVIKNLNNIKPIEQNHSEATLTKTLKKQNGYFDIENPPSKEMLEKMTRAFCPWPGVWTKVKIRDKEKIIKFLPASPNQGGPNKKIQVEGKKPMEYKDFINGYPELEKTFSKIF